MSASTLDRAAFKAGAAAQREADLELFKQWCADLELPFGSKMEHWHTFGIEFFEYLRGQPLAKK